MEQLKESMDVMGDLESAGLVELQTSKGATRTLALMLEVRSHLHAADVRLTAAVEALLVDSILDKEKKD